MKYCARCGTVMDEPAYFALKAASSKPDGRVICPVRGCYNEIIDVDEAFIPLLKRLYDAGIVTMHSCAGHFWELESRCEDIYFTYDYDFDVAGKGLLKKFTENLISLAKPGACDFLEVRPVHESSEAINSYRDLDGERQAARTVIRVSAKKPIVRRDASLLKKQGALLRRQAEFMLAVEDALRDAELSVKK